MIMRKEKRKMMKYSYSSNKIVEERIRKMIRKVGRNDKKMENKEDRNER